MTDINKIIEGVRAGTVDEAYAAPFLLDEIDRLREALNEVNGCFQAAIAEGLYDRLGEIAGYEPGSIYGLFMRRIIPANETAVAALAISLGATP